MFEDSSAIHPSGWNLSSELLGNMHLETRNSEPYYLQLQRQIEALVRSGALPVGTGIPSERDLAEMLNISRPTVRRCYEALRRARVLVSKGGRCGTVVQGVPHVAPPVRAATSLAGEPDHPSATRVLERAVVSDHAMASLFNRAPDSEFLRLVRLRLADGGEPMLREVAWYDLSLAPQMANWSGDGSAHAFLREQCGLNPAWARQSIEAATSSLEEARAFGLAVPAPCLLLKRQTYTADNRLVEYVEGTFRNAAHSYPVKPGQDWDGESCDPFLSLADAQPSPSL